MTIYICSVFFRWRFPAALAATGPVPPPSGAAGRPHRPHGLPGGQRSLRHASLHRKITSVVDLDPDSDSVGSLDPGSDSRSGSKRVNMAQKNRIQLINFIFWSAGCSLLRAEDFSCSVDVLYGGPIFQFLIYKKKKDLSCIFSNSLSSKPWIRIRIRIHNTENKPWPLLLLTSMPKTELSLSRTVFVGDSWLFLNLPFVKKKQCSLLLSAYCLSATSKLPLLGSNTMVSQHCRNS